MKYTQLLKAIDDASQHLVGRAAAAEANGLGPDDFEHILNSFPVFARKRPAFLAYLRQRLDEWKIGG